jgi:hypothetical protein
VQGDKVLCLSVSAYGFDLVYFIYLLPCIEENKCTTQIFHNSRKRMLQWYKIIAIYNQTFIIIEIIHEALW